MSREQKDVDRRRLPDDFALVRASYIPAAGPAGRASTSSAFTLRRPFLLEPATPPRAAVLLVHGFTGTPFEMRLLGEQLCDRGYLVYGPRLAGHGETSEALSRSSWRDWSHTVDEAFDYIQTRHERVCVAGLSLGGLLTLDLAKRRGQDITAIAALAAPLWLPRAIELVISVTKKLGRSPTFTIPKGAGSDISEPRMRQRNNLAQGAVGFAVPAVLALHEFMRKVREELPRVRVPTLAVHARNDHVAPYACMAALAAELGTRDLETLTLERSYHVVTLDWEREIVARAVDKHFARYLARVT